MAQIGLTLDFSGYSGFLLVVAKKATAPLAEVWRSAALPFPVATNVTIPNLQDETYILEFWRSSDGIALQTLLRQWSIDAGAYSGAVVSQYDYVVDRGSSGSNPDWEDPVQDDTEIHDERLIGAIQSELSVERRNIGPLLNSEYSILPGGGIKLEVPLDIFNSGEVFIIKHFKKVSSSPNSASIDYADLVTITGNVTIDNTHKNKLIICTSALAVTTVTFPDFVTMADQKLRFSTHGMTGNYLSLQFTTAVMFHGENALLIDLGKNKWIELMIKGGVCYLLGDGTDYHLRGTRQLVDVVGQNQLALDGTERNISDWPGIVRFIVNKLAPAQIITSFASWNTDANRHKWYYNVVDGKFRVPNDYNMTYKGSETLFLVPGTYHADQVGDHKHDTYNGTIGGNGIGASKPVRGQYASSGAGTTDYTFSNNPGAENRVKSVLQIPVVNI